MVPPLSEAGATLKGIELFLGDSDMDVIIKHYVKLDNDMKKSTSRKFSNFLNQVGM